MLLLPYLQTSLAAGRPKAAASVCKRNRACAANDCFVSSRQAAVSSCWGQLWLGASCSSNFVTTVLLLLLLTCSKHASLQDDHTTLYNLCAFGVRCPYYPDVVPGVRCIWQDIMSCNHAVLSMASLADQGNQAVQDAHASGVHVG